MVDRTVYANEAATPKLNLRQIFGRQGLDTGLCRLSADKGLLTVEMFAMLGQDLSSAKETLRKLWEADMSPLGADAASQELSVMSLAAVWQAAQALQTQYASRRARMEEDPNKIPELSQEDHAEFRDPFVRVHPDVILIDAKEPRKKFVERLSRDFLIHGIVPFCEPAEIRTRADVIVVKSGLSRNAEDLLSISRADQPEPVTDVTTLFQRLHAFFMALEYLNICAFSRAEGPLKYLQELEQFRSECPGLPFLMAADHAIRKKIFRLLSEQTATTFSQALLEVLANHKYLWNDARTSVTLSKVEHNRQQFVANPIKFKMMGKKKKKRLQTPGKEETPKKIPKEDPAKKMKRDDRIPEKEWKLIADAAKKVQGARDRSRARRSQDSPLARRDPAARVLSAGSGTTQSSWREGKQALFFAGAYRHGGITRLRASCRSWPWSIQAITKYIQQKAPETVFTSFAILYDQEAKPHRESGNDATPNVVIKLSDFQGGGLWIEDPLGQDARDIDGRVIPGVNTDFDQDVIVFNAKEALHMTLPWEGTRVVLAVYSVQGVDRIPADEFELMQLGFNPAPVQTGDHADAPWQAPTFALRTEAADRKRPHGAPVRVRDHRQRSSGQKAIAAGYQMKKSVVLPLITTEMHPGEAIEFALDVIHPFTQDAAIDSDLQAVLQELVDHPKAVCDRRESLLRTWDARARDLVPESEKLLKQIPDRHLRCLLRGVPDDQPVELGAFFHVALWRELLQQASCSDVDLVDQIMAGMPIVGDIASSHRWAADRKPHADHLSVDSLRSRAWEFRSKVLRAIKRAPLTEHSPKVWEATLEDVAEGAAVGPFFEESEVSEFVGDDHWIPTQRFEVVQKNKVRGVDSAASNGINMATVVTEKLELPSTDANVAVIKWLRSRLPDKALRGWVLDERRAYRQVPISPGHRKWSVVALKDPSTGKVAFFVMVGHSFGLVSAVYNYNRRSAAITDILRRMFSVAAFNLYDDKYGFEPEDTAASAFALAEKVHWWLGARFDQQKLQLCSDPTILGVTYDLEQYLLKIKKSRKKELSDEISMILEHEELSPGQAGKLRGKLMPIPGSGSRKSDIVIFTDGSAPSSSPKDPATEMIGGVMFTREDSPKQFSSDVPKLIVQRWFPRKTQICMIELLAAVVAVQTFREEIRGKLVLLFIDSEPVEAALIKGYSAKEDVCELAIDPWPFWHEPIGRAQKNPPTPPFVLLFNMGDRPQIGPDQVALQALAVGTQDELCRPCVDCGLYTGCYCDGNDWGECFAADRLPHEHWANNQRTPLCTPAIVASACAISAGASSGPSLLPIATKIAMLPLPGLFPLAAMISRSFIWLKRGLSLSKVGPLQLPDTSISPLRTILAVTTTCSSGRLLKEPAVMLLRILAALGIRKPSRHQPQLRSRPTTRTMLGLAGLDIRLARAVPKRRPLQMLPFARPSGSLSPCLEQLLSMTIPSKSRLPQSETRSKISLDFVRWEYRSSDVFDRMDVAVVGDADAHTR
ncbi:hypothetical protein AK812_SmicGene34786 [Symbiodinium microadriaticum]|uniref:Uncharacterized protein n=1 Tax=Symbiodinium microadriaticum TaxID=2951 RepID=A0A1Q9CN59_SYMMI|nr:hypothetical protein AK812_SmicGene34786 [Symbiodinium microadriaticum]